MPCSATTSAPRSAAARASATEPTCQAARAPPRWIASISAASGRRRRTRRYRARRDVEDRGVRGPVEERLDEVHAHHAVGARADLGQRRLELGRPRERRAYHADPARPRHRGDELHVQRRAEPGLLDGDAAAEQPAQIAHPTRSSDRRVVTGPVRGEHHPVAARRPPARPSPGGRRLAAQLARPPRPARACRPPRRPAPPRAGRRTCSAPRRRSSSVHAQPPHDVAAGDEAELLGLHGDHDRVVVVEERRVDVLRPHPRERPQPAARRRRSPRRTRGPADGRGCAAPRSRARGRAGARRRGAPVTTTASAPVTTGTQS